LRRRRASNEPTRWNPSTDSYQVALADTSRTVSPMWWMPSITSSIVADARRKDFVSNNVTITAT
jgi:hypothetical protein